MGSVTIRTFKSYGSPNNKQWLNTYEGNDGGSVVDAAVDPTAFIALADAIITAERAIHSGLVYFNRYTISTWQADSQPYDPDNLVTTPLALQGQNPMLAVANYLDLRMVLWVARKTPTGRPGKLSYRGCLGEEIVTSVGGREVLDTASASWSGWVTQWNAYLAALAPYMNVEGAVPKLVMIGGTLEKYTQAAVEAGQNVIKLRRRYVSPYNIRTIQTMIHQGVSISSLDHRYFDRP